MNDVRQQARNAARSVRALAPGFAPQTALILGTGLGEAIAGRDTLATIPYGELSGFQSSGVQSHKGELALARSGSCDVVVMRGRFHLYEGHRARAMLAPIATFRELGCTTLIVTNAANALHQGHKPPSLMLISDHINAMGDNPLIGTDGNRFVDMSEVYDGELREQTLATAKRLGIALHQGVYYAMLGPCFETRAEAAMARKLGADAIGMSSVPETIVARSFGMNVLGFSALTNHAADIAKREHTVEEVIAGAQAVAGALGRLLGAVIAELR